MEGDILEIEDTKTGEKTKTTVDDIGKVFLEKVFNN